MTEHRKSIWYYIRQYKFRSLMIRNFGLIVLAVIAPLVVVVTFGYRELHAEMNNRMMGMNEELLQSNAVVADNMFKNMAALQAELAAESAAAHMLENETGGAESEADALALYQQMRPYMENNPHINNIYLYSEVSGKMIDYQTHIWVDARDAARKGKWYYIHQTFPMDRQYTLVDGDSNILLCQPMFGYQKQRTGLIVFDVQMSRLTELLESEQLLKKGVFLIADVNCRVIYCSSPELEQNRYSAVIRKLQIGQSRQLNGDETLIASMMLSETQTWRYVFITEMSQYKTENDVLSGFLLTTVSVGLVVSLLAAYFITVVTYRPVKKIVDVIETPERFIEENPTVATPQEAKDAGELLYITSNILNTLNTKAQMDEELESRIQALRKAQTQALQFQIDPHFLYNTLETIKWSAVEEIGLGNTVSKLITKVARLYRTALDGSNVIVTLREEMAFLDLYVDILNTRYGGSIDFKWEIAESLYGCKVIKMCIQPLIENAVSHGLKPLGYRGGIRIHAFCEKDTLCICVDNDGAGIPDESLAEINRRLQSRVGFEGQRVGLRNVNERVKLVYGGEYGVSLQKIEQDGKKLTRSLITFPYRPEQTERGTQE